jgi:hypothetical protein
MQRFKKILLLASNGKEMSETLERAVELSEDNQAQMTVVDGKRMDYSLNSNGCYATDLTRLLSITAKINMTAMSTLLAFIYIPPGSKHSHLSLA